MKAFATALLCVALAAAASAESCFTDVSSDCLPQANLILSGCNAKYGNFSTKGNLHIELQAYANLHLKRSYEYLLSAAFFNNYQTNRMGFHKLFRKLSDDTWAKTQDIIKHITMRGGVMDFKRRSTYKSDLTDNRTIELAELQSLAFALDTQKDIAERAFYIHREATKNSHDSHDADITQYMEEEFIEDHSKTIRDLAGYTSDLKRFITGNEGKDLSLALYVFDEYLQKVA